jgi:hypothetical protein
LYNEHGFSYELLEGVGAIQAIYTVGADDSILELDELLVAGGGGVGAHEHAGALHCEVGECFYLLHEGLLVPFQLKLHIDFAVVDGVLLLEVVAVDEGDGVEVLS